VSHSDDSVGTRAPASAGAPNPVAPTNRFVKGPGHTR
jgi:hypothetical protein